MNSRGTIIKAMEWKIEFVFLLKVENLKIRVKNEINVTRGNIDNKSKDECRIVAADIK